MQWEYWRNNDTTTVYGFDVSDPAQVAAKDQLTATGNWTNITGNWPPPPSLPTAEQNKSKAVLFLQQTDWVNEPDVTDTQNTPHLLNKTDFLNYRALIRPIAVNPTSGNIDWPTMPVAQWSS